MENQEKKKVVQTLTGLPVQGLRPFRVERQTRRAGYEYFLIFNFVNNLGACEETDLW